MQSILQLVPRILTCTLDRIGMRWVGISAKRMIKRHFYVLGASVEE